MELTNLLKKLTLITIGWQYFFFLKIINSHCCNSCKIDHIYLVKHYDYYHFFNYEFLIFFVNSWQMLFKKSLTNIAYLSNLHNEIVF